MISISTIYNVEYNIQYIYILYSIKKYWSSVWVCSLSDKYSICCFKQCSERQLSKILWMQVCWLRYRKDHKNITQCKTNHADNFTEVTLSEPRRGRPSAANQLPHAYLSRIPISDLKYKYLISLCKSLLFQDTVTSTTKNCRIVKKWKMSYRKNENFKLNYLES